MPVPAKLRLVLRGRVSEKVLALGATSVVLEVANVAVSRGELGTVDGVQFVAVFQSPVAGLVPQVALPARA